jgi:hypothetical protein
MSPVEEEKKACYEETTTDGPSDGPDEDCFISASASASISVSVSISICVSIAIPLGGARVSNVEGLRFCNVYIGSEGRKIGPIGVRIALVEIENEFVD